MPFVFLEHFMVSIRNLKVKEFSSETVGDSVDGFTVKIEIQSQYKSGRLLDDGFSLSVRGLKMYTSLSRFLWLFESDFDADGWIWWRTCSSLAWKPPKACRSCDA